MQMNVHRTSLGLTVLILMIIVTFVDSPATLYAVKTTPTSNSTIYFDAQGSPMIAVPKGTFKIGYKLDDALHLCELLKPLDAIYPCSDMFVLDSEEVNVNGFYLDQFEVSKSDYAKCVEADVCDGRPFDIQDPQSTDTPIQYLSYYDAAVYCAWRKSRLPTEIEWEYAARGPNSLTFPWGNNFNGTYANFCDKNCRAPKGIANTAWDDKYLELAPVNSFENGKSWVGTYNMAGNIAEWTSTRVFPKNASNPSDFRIVKGGSYGSYAHQITGYSRFWIEAQSNQEAIGLRCAHSTK